MLLVGLVVLVGVSVMLAGCSAGRRLSAGSAGSAAVLVGCQCW